MSSFVSYVAAGLICGDIERPCDSKLLMGLLSEMMERVLAGDPSIEPRLAWDALCEVMGTDGLREMYPEVYFAAEKALHALDDAAEEEVPAKKKVPAKRPALRVV
jgi:hypothetical protein